MYFTSPNDPLVKAARLILIEASKKAATSKKDVPASKSVDSLTGKEKAFFKIVLNHKKQVVKVYDDFGLDFEDETSNLSFEKDDDGIFHAVTSNAYIYILTKKQIVDHKFGKPDNEHIIKLPDNEFIVIVCV